MESEGREGAIANADRVVVDSDCGVLCTVWCLCPMADGRMGGCANAALQADATIALAVAVGAESTPAGYEGDGMSQRRRRRFAGVSLVPAGNAQSRMRVCGGEVVDRWWWETATARAEGARRESAEGATRTLCLHCLSQSNFPLVPNLAIAAPCGLLQGLLSASPCLRGSRADAPPASPGLGLHVSCSIVDVPTLGCCYLSSMEALL